MGLILTTKNRPNFKPSFTKPLIRKTTGLPYRLQWICACYILSRHQNSYAIHGRLGTGKTPKEAYTNWVCRNHRSIK